MAVVDMNSHSQYLHRLTDSSLEKMGKSKLLYLTHGRRKFYEQIVNR